MRSLRYGVNDQFMKADDVTTATLN
ncbi:MAG: hypothetical protein QOH68_706, partial [Nocardioidaceae bacterium]|nr:hypothetical protein [Nocardioidaceae bacterium]